MEPESQESALSPAIDRARPLVAWNLRWQRFAIGGIAIVALAMIAAMALQEARPEETALEASNEETFHLNTAQDGKPYIAPVPEMILPSITPVSGKTEYDPTETQRLTMMQQEAMRTAQERKKKQMERLYSNQLVIDKLSKNGAVHNTTPQQLAGLETSGGTLLGGTSDENLDFSNQRKNNETDTIGAVQLDNLDGLIPQGTMISGILETAIKSNLPGMVRAIVSEDVYSFDKSNLLIPSGSALVGQYRSEIKQGQSRVFVIWDRLIRPDGVSITLTSFGTDSLGVSGLEGDVDTHFKERFGSSIMLSLIDAAIRVGVEAADDDGAATVAVDTGDDFSRASEIALNNSINIPPTIHIDQGERIKVFVGRDLDFSTVKQTAWRE